MAVKPLLSVSEIFARAFTNTLTIGKLPIEEANRKEKNNKIKFLINEK